MRYLFVLVGLVVLIAGCAGQQITDPIELAKQTSIASSYISTVPDASTQVFNITKAEIEGQKAELEQICGAKFEVENYKKVLLSSKEVETEVTVWIDADNSQVICAIKKAASGQVSVEKPAETSTTKKTTTTKATATTSGQTTDTGSTTIPEGKKADGEACNEHNECDSGYCLNRVCTEPPGGRTTTTAGGTTSSTTSTASTTTTTSPTCHLSNCGTCSSQSACTGVTCIWNSTASSCSAPPTTTTSSSTTTTTAGGTTTTAGGTTTTAAGGTTTTTSTSSTTTTASPTCAISNCGACSSQSACTTAGCSWHAILSTCITPTTTTTTTTTPTTTSTTTTSTTTTTTAPKPDLTITITGFQNKGRQTNMVVTNSGNGDSNPGSIQVIFYQGGIPKSSCSTSFASLDAGESSPQRSCAVSSAQTPAGTYDVTATVDYINGISESNENNNQATSTSTVIP